MFHSDIGKNVFPARYMMLVYYIFCTLTRTLIHLSVNKVCCVTATENMLNYFTYVTCSGRPIRIDVTIFTSYGELPGPFCWIHYYSNAIQFFHRRGKFCIKQNLITNFCIYRYVTGGRGRNDVESVLWIVSYFLQEISKIG